MSNAGSKFAYVRERIRKFLRPPVRITPPPEDTLVFTRDVEVPMRDGVLLRANTFVPRAGGPFPVIVCAHPYSKDALPKRGWSGYRTPAQYRLMRADGQLEFSAWTSWEAPDPAYWCARGYAVVNCDLRGFGRADGVGTLLAKEEGDDYHDLIEWCAEQSWCTGKVGLLGVSYLALSQWRAAATRPAHLAAIAPWEGFCDVYRDLAYVGGVRENGFVRMWSAGTRRAGRTPMDFRAEQCARPTWDAFWEARLPDVEAINVPALVCASFSDHNLHSRGSFEAFQRLGSTQKWLYTHRGGKWRVFYSDEAKAFQTRFFDHFLKGEANGMETLPAVRLEVRETGSGIHAVREETAWPLARTEWTPFYLGANNVLSQSPDAVSLSTRVHTKRGAASFALRFGQDTEITGPMKLVLWVSLEKLTDANVFAMVHKLDREGNRVYFEGSYGYGRDGVARGTLRLAHRALDAARSTPWRPFHAHTRDEPVAAGAVERVEIEVLASSTWFRAGESLELVVQGHPCVPFNPFTGQFPARYPASESGVLCLHHGGSYDAHLLVPRIPLSP